ncbi:MAG: hypothetical protein LBC61_02140 [Candidatus Peribacteria bacterium]|nr:hypothetical protein [Candidatus Peribacteria bacterium]
MFLNISKVLSFTNSGQSELILILGMLVFSKMYSNNSLNFELFISFVLLAPQAQRFTPVKTTSFHHIFSNSKISVTISSLSLE